MLVVDRRAGVPAELARERSSRCSRSRCRWSAPSRRWRRSASRSTMLVAVRARARDRHRRRRRDRRRRRTSSGISRRGMTPAEATYKAMEEVGRRADRDRASALCAVFVPTAFFSAALPGNSSSTSPSPSRSRHRDLLASARWTPLSPALASLDPAASRTAGAAARRHAWNS